MDNAYYEDLAGQLYGLLIRLDDRLPREQAQWLHHAAEAGEYGLALEDMAGMPAHGTIAITGAEREDMLAVILALTPSVIAMLAAYLAVAR